jgi:predicted TIM-barrel enzyme
VSDIRPGHLFFAAVAFKGQAPDPFPADSAALAAYHGLIPTTSGTGTGVAPDVEKIRRIRARLQLSDRLAVASGITPENIGQFAPHLTHVLVATGISSSFHEFDAAKLGLLMRNAA